MNDIGRYFIAIVITIRPLKNIVLNEWFKEVKMLSVIYHKGYKVNYFFHKGIKYRVTIDRTKEIPVIVLKKIKV